MKVSKRTVRTDMRERAIINTMRGVYQSAMEAEGEDEEVIALALSFFAELSARVTFNGKDKVPFDLVKPSDPPNVMMDKFHAFLESERDAADLVEAARTAMREMDFPVDPETGPEPLPEDAGKKSD